MNVILWILSGLLAALFAMAGAMKIATPKEKLLDNPNMAWAEDFSPGMLRFIGIAEVAGALGLVLPGAVDVATWLVPAAATGLAIVMLGAATTHLRRHELPNVVATVGLFAVAAFVAVERFGPQSL